MIRFIDLGDQICEGYKEFAWFNTATDTFMECSYEQTWESWPEFEDSYRTDPTVGYPLERFRRLYPKDWEENKGEVR